PLVLAHALRPAALLPEVHPPDALMAPPQRPMVAVVGGSRVAQARQGPARRAEEWEEEGARVAGGSVPAKALLPVHLKRELIIGLGDDLNARHNIRHGKKLRGLGQQG